MNERKTGSPEEAAKGNKTETAPSSLNEAIRNMHALDRELDTFSDVEGDEVDSEGYERAMEKFEAAQEQVRIQALAEGPAILAELHSPDFPTTTQRQKLIREEQDLAAELGETKKTLREFDPQTDVQRFTHLKEKSEEMQSLMKTVDKGIREIDRTLSKFEVISRALELTTSGTSDPDRLKKAIIDFLEKK